MSKPERIRIGIIGAGHIAQIVHIPVWSRIDDVEVVSICDIVGSKAKWVAEKFGIQNHSADPDELFKSPDIDAIDICTETDTHKDLAIAALSAGKHVLVEKPMARTYNEAQAMSKAAEKYGKHLMVAMNVRFRRDAITLKSFVDGNELGDIFYAKSNWVNRRDFRKNTKHWHYNKERAGGGVLMDLGIQMLDVASWLLGDMKPVTAKAVTFNRIIGLNVEDTATCFIHYENGAVLSLEVSWTLLSERDHLQVNLYGDEGSALINPLRIYKNLNNKLVNITPSKDEDVNVRYRRSYKNELRHFIACLNQNIPMQASANEIADRLRILQALYRSAKEGREVKV